MRREKELTLKERCGLPSAGAFRSATWKSVHLLQSKSPQCPSSRHRCRTGLRKCAGGDVRRQEACHRLAPAYRTAAVRTFSKAPPPHPAKRLATRGSDFRCSSKQMKSLCRWISGRARSRIFSISMAINKEDAKVQSRKSEFGSRL